MNARGFTLLEVITAIALLGIMLAAIVPSILTYLDTNTGNEARTGSIAAAQQTLETFRQLDPTSLPTSGTVTTPFAGTDGREYEITTTYCAASEHCTTNSRHLLIEVRYGGQLFYRTESVFTKLR